MTSLLTDEFGAFDNPRAGPTNDDILAPTPSAAETMIMKLGKADEKEQQPPFYEFFGQKFTKAQELISAYQQKVFVALASQIKTAHDADLAATREENRMLTLKLVREREGTDGSSPDRSRQSQKLRKGKSTTKRLSDQSEDRQSSRQNLSREPSFPTSTAPSTGPIMDPFLSVHESADKPAQQLPDDKCGEGQPTCEPICEKEMLPCALPVLPQEEKHAHAVLALSTTPVTKCGQEYDSVVPETIGGPRPKVSFREDTSASVVLASANMQAGGSSSIILSSEISSDSSSVGFLSESDSVESCSKPGATDCEESRGQGRKSHVNHGIKFEVLASWQKGNESLAAKMGNRTVDAHAFVDSALVNSPFGDDESDEEAEAVRKEKGCWGKFIVHPNSIRRGTWEGISLALVIYDIIFIPMQLLEPPESVFTRAMEWVTRMFWTGDMAASLLTGFTTTDGFIEMRRWPILKRYMRTWLGLDLMIVGVDWMEILWNAAAGAGYGRIARASRAFRIIRMIRLLRLLRLKDLIIMMFEYARSESIKEMADMIKWMMMMVGFAHLVACCWYGIGVDIGESLGFQEAWVKSAFTYDDGWAYRYVTSLHWSLAQFSGGMDSIAPINMLERVYAVSVYLVAFMMGAVLVGSLTSSMTQLRMLANEKSTKLLLLRRYLNDNTISTRLALRVQRNAQHAMIEQQRYIPEVNVELLNMVSEPLRIELHFELYAKILMNHPFFEEYIYTCPHIMQKVCHSAATMTMVSIGDIIFNVGEIPPKPKMIVLVSGALHYRSLGAHGSASRCRKSRRGATMADKTKLGTNLNPGQWVAEAVMWTHWMHRGVLTATTDCRLCLLDAQKFGETVGAFDHDGFNPKLYAAQYVKGLNSGEELSDLVSGLEQHALDKVKKIVFKRKGGRRTSKGSVVGFFGTS